MAKSERNRVRDDARFDLTDEDVNRQWKEIVELARRNPGEATTAWDVLGTNYISLGDRSTG